MQKDIFEKIINFLLGASWAFILFGALFTFKVFLPFGIAFSLFLSFFFVVFSLFLVLILDSFLVKKQLLAEAKKQTKLLEKIYNEKKEKEPNKEDS